MNLFVQGMYLGVFRDQLGLRHRFSGVRYNASLLQHEHCTLLGLLRSEINRLQQKLLLVPGFRLKACLLLCEREGCELNRLPYLAVEGWGHLLGEVGTPDYLLVPVLRCH